MYFHGPLSWPASPPHSWPAERTGEIQAPSVRDTCQDAPQRDDARTLDREAPLGGSPEKRWLRNVYVNILQAHCRDWGAPGCVTRTAAGGPVEAVPREPVGHAEARTSLSGKLNNRAQAAPRIGPPSVNTEGCVSVFHTPPVSCQVKPPETVTKPSCLEGAWPVRAPSTRWDGASGALTPGSSRAAHAEGAGRAGGSRPPGFRHSSLRVGSEGLGHPGRPSKFICFWRVVSSFLSSCF